MNVLDSVVRRASEASDALRRTGVFLRHRFDTWQRRHGYGTGEAAARLAGYGAAAVVAVPLFGWVAIQLVSILTSTVGWLAGDPPVPELPGPVAQSLERAVPALAELITGSITNWFQAHTAGMVVTARGLGLLWAAGASVITLGALARIRGAQIGYGLLTAATTVITWQGAPDQARVVAAGTVALLGTVVGMFTAGRVRTRIHNAVDARDREKPADELDREREQAAAWKQLGDAAAEFVEQRQTPRSAPFTAQQLDEAAEVAESVGLERTLLPSEMAVLLRTARTGDT